MRTRCLKCVRKHIGSALALLPELLLGYPEHITRVCGELDQAAQEALRVDVALSAAIREFRLAAESAFDCRFAGADANAICGMMPDDKMLVDLVEEAFQKAVANTKTKKKGI